jgi:hypothetical protein
MGARLRQSLSNDQSSRSFPTMLAAVSLHDVSSLADYRELANLKVQPTE